MWKFTDIILLPTKSVKVSILCASVGPKTYHIIKNLCLPDKPETKTFKELTDIVKGYYKPKISEASASLIFNNRVRKPEETVQVFVAELRRLVQSCNYGDHLKRALRDFNAKTTTKSVVSVDK